MKYKVKYKLKKKKNIRFLFWIFIAILWVIAMYISFLIRWELGLIYLLLSFMVLVIKSCLSDE